MSDPREAFKERAEELATESRLPVEACLVAVQFLGGTAGEYLISDETLALLIAVANGLMPREELPKSLRLP